MHTRFIKTLYKYVHFSMEKSVVNYVLIVAWQIPLTVDSRFHSNLIPAQIGIGTSTAATNVWITNIHVYRIDSESGQSRGQLQTKFQPTVDRNKFGNIYFMWSSCFFFQPSSHSMYQMYENKSKRYPYRNLKQKAVNKLRQYRSLELEEPKMN